MDITYLGHSAFKLKGKNTSLVTDPSDPKVTGLKFPKISADIVTVSHTQHSDHKSVELVSDVKKVISGPGEYEIQGVSIIGFPAYHDNKKGSERGKNTIYVIEIEKLRVAHLGDLGHKLDEKQVEAIGEIDVLIVPVGGFFTIGSKRVVEVVRAIEPGICIPMHFNTKGLNQTTFGKLEPVDTFLKEMGLPVEKLDKLRIQKELDVTEQKVVVLSHK